MASELLVVQSVSKREKFSMTIYCELTENSDRRPARTFAAGGEG